MKIRLPHKAIAAAAASVAVLSLAGCKVGPEYRRPELQVPSSFASTQPTTQPSPVANELVHWWQLLNDSQLSTLIERATAANLDVKIAAERVRQARAQRGIEVGGGQPQVSAAGEYSRNQSSDNFANIPGGTSPYSNYIAGFDASWEIDVFGGRKRRVEAADARVLSSVESERDVLITVQAEVASAYNDLRANQKRLEVAEQAVIAQQDLADLVRSRFAAGLVSDLDVARADAQVASTRAQIPLFAAAIRIDMHRLGILLGRGPADSIAELEAPRPIPLAPPEIPAGIPGELLQRRPDIRQAEADLIAATANIGVARADLYPKFSLLGNVGLQSAQFANWWQADSNFWSIGPQVRWSILNGGQVRSNIRLQTSLQEQSLLRYQQTILNSVEEVENALTRYAQEQRRRALLLNSVSANQRALKVADELYQRGLTDFTPVLDAQRTLYSSQDQLVASEGNVTTFAIAIYKALGGGWMPKQ